MSWVLEADLKISLAVSVTNGCSVSGAPSRRSTIDQPDPALAEGRHPEDGEVHPNEEGTPQGGSISVMLSNVYLHYVLICGSSAWLTSIARGGLSNQIHRRLCDVFPISGDALRVQAALCKRLGKFGLTLEPTKTKLVEFGRFAQRHATKHGRKRPETIYFLGFTLYCTRNLKGNFKVGMRTEK